MPKDTFFNLSQEKQDRIMEAAVREFAEKGYQKCSVQVIANEAGVAKGSMYQYFESKKELFFNILDIAAQKKMELVGDRAKDLVRKDFFEMLEILFDVGLRFSIEHRDYYRIYQDIQETAPQEIREEFNERMGAISHDYYKNLINSAMQKGELRSDINIELIAFVFVTLLKNFADFYLEVFGFEYKIAHKKYIGQFIEVMKNGMGKGDESND